ncbi:MAG TPA: FAD-dependent oxidoreductase, partial [Aggregatilineales bacterium]|nr:FAD-dependent oxidoreductase [Aggregatilineales bacterium]
AAQSPLQNSRVCLYTMTPDEHFILDCHPEYSNIIIGAGFSGHGFKFTTFIGRTLSNLAVGVENPVDLSLFQIGRFSDES